MEPAVHFTEGAKGAHVAWSAWGEGPALVVPPGWVGHLRVARENASHRAFFDRLARRHTVVTYDRPGTGLSDRAPRVPSLDADVVDLDAVTHAAGLSRFDLLGASQGGPVAAAYAALHPERVRRLVLYGAYARGRDVAKPEVQASLVALVRAHWGLGSGVLASLFIPENPGDPQAVERLGCFQRAATDGETAARLLESVYAYDVSPLLPQIRAETLVLHRSGDRAIPARCGRNLAAGIARADLVLLDGDVHLPWLGDAEAVLDRIEGFLEAPEPAPAGDGASEHRPPRIRHATASGVPGERIGIALAQLEVPFEAFVQRPDGLLALGDAALEVQLQRVRDALLEAARRHVRLVVLPELALDTSRADVVEELVRLCAAGNLVVVAGGWHDPATRRNLARVYGPEGLLWEQPKHVPAMLRLAGKQETERIAVPPVPEVVVGDTPAGRVAVLVCRDFLDLDLRAELRHAEPPVDVVVNPAFTPVTADFTAAHFEARRSLYAACCFCNAARFGGSCVQLPVKGASRRPLPPGPRLLVRELDLIGLRDARRQWALVRRQQFVQSTR